MPSWSIISGSIIAGFPSLLSAWPVALYLPSLPINSVNIVHQLVHNCDHCPPEYLIACARR
jgi:hypothetical protein